ncbi:MAG: 16S rRNA (cytidine(1402)-2'-O)-methyltransferase [Helicobacter sp.]|nr:16S rRNA (cytidine(1402)-2'-O)-methyltransferase [Helicobacter sp.]
MLTLVSTPLGNLNDITLRGLETIFRAQVILCEDTRVAKKLYFLLIDKGLFNSLSSCYFTKDEHIQRFKQKSFLAFHSHNQEKFLRDIRKDFFTQDVIYISDAGMPCISDPGAILVSYCIRHGIEYDVLPGISALNVCFAASGIESSRFFFGGFLPHKQTDRKQTLSFYTKLGFPCIWYESPHRLLQTLKDMESTLPDAYICACKEISKIHQKRYFGSATEIIVQLQGDRICGEWVLCVENRQGAQEFQNGCNSIGVEDIIALPLAPKLKAKLLAKITQKPIKQCYEELLFHTV